MKIARLAMTASIAVACGFGFAAAAAEPAHTHWGYEGAAGPADWGHLSPDFAACEGGKAQSPVDIAKTIPAKLGPVAVSYQGGAVEVVNNGHTIQANPKATSSIEVEGKRYDLLQFHFHHPSEHAVNGKRAPMELHLVHKNQETGDLVVLGVMIVPGAANPALDAVWTVMPDKEGTAKSPATVDPAQLLPAGRDYFRYEGSLTTPPCSEVVHWVTFKQPITASDAQINRFAALFKDNARPLQPLNRRFVLESEGK
ncbi:carbonic anhydrase [Oleisolibacter albus]|uniref:carbonic anhydrase n=1 Tax=Oleisolibacter albus TaxID=2171757 RepID=UPI000DF2F26B|nr:carbonic anhydrase family protein [Oleisolibacter albus]